MMQKSQDVATISLEKFYLELKETIAQSKYFISAQKSLPEKLTKVCSETMINRKCGDSVTIEAFAAKNHREKADCTKSNSYSLYYSGCFCAVCHLSAELMCQNFQSLVDEQAAYQSDASQPVFFSSHHIESIRQAIEIFSTAGEVQEDEYNKKTGQTNRMLFYFNQTLNRMPSRKTCALLPWKAALNLTNSLYKNRNILT